MQASDLSAFTFLLTNSTNVQITLLTTQQMQKWIMKVGPVDIERHNKSFLEIFPTTFCKHLINNE